MPGSCPPLSYIVSANQRRVKTVLHPGLCVDTNSWISHVFLIILPEKVDFQFVFLSKIVLHVNQNLRVIAFGQ